MKSHGAKDRKANSAEASVSRRAISQILQTWSWTRYWEALQATALLPRHACSRVFKVALGQNLKAILAGICQTQALREQREGSWLTSPRPSPSPRPAGAERREGTSIGPNRWKHEKTRTEKKETNFLSTSKTVSVVPQRGTCNNKFKSHRPLSKEAIKRQIINGKQAHFRHNSIWAAHRLSKRRSSLFPTLSGFLLLLFLLFISSVGQKWNKLPFWYEPCTSQVQKHEAKLGGLQPFPIRSMGLGLMARGWNVVWDMGQRLELKPCCSIAEMQHVYLPPCPSWVASPSFLQEEQKP